MNLLAIRSFFNLHHPIPHQRIIILYRPVWEIRRFFHKFQIEILGAFRFTGFFTTSHQEFTRVPEIHRFFHMV